MRLNRSSLSKIMSSLTKEVPRNESLRIIWVDLEMTGLDINKDHILEMACLITDDKLDLIEKGPHVIIHQPEEILSNMNEWSKYHHQESGLTEASRKSPVSLQAAEYKMLSFVRKHVPQGHCPLAGNSVHADKRFLDKFMPQFMGHLHYRIIDTSSIKELCRRWYPQILPPRKMMNHRALDDILESIEELKFYKKTIFKHPNDVFL